MQWEKEEPKLNYHWDDPLTLYRAQISLVFCYGFDIELGDYLFSSIKMSHSFIQRIFIKDVLWLSH